MGPGVIMKLRSLSPLRRVLTVAAGLLLPHLCTAATSNVLASLNNARGSSPNGAVEFIISSDQGRLMLAVASRKQTVIEPSPLHFTLDGIDLAQSVVLGKMEPYQIEETYPWYGAHARATNRCNG